MIPKIIHQTYKDKNLPNLFKENQSIIKKLHPDFEYKFYTDNDMYEFIKLEFPKYYNKFMNLPRKIMQIDMFRYFLMYKYGGIYVDLDYRFFKKFNLLNHKIIIPSSRNDPLVLGNSIFASEPNHNFWKKLMDTLFCFNRNIKFKSKKDVILSTGPQFVTKMWKNYTNKEDIYIPSKKLFHPKLIKNNIKLYIFFLIKQNISYGIHLCSGLWIKNNY